MKTISTIALAAAFAGAATPALADDAPEDIIITAIGAAQNADETGQAVTIIDRAAIERSQAVVATDLLMRTPGVSVTRTGGPGAVTALRIRGAEDGQTLVLIDGVRAGDPSAPSGAFDFGHLMIGNFDRIEVVRGPNSVPWGSQALGGVVNIMTARPAEGLQARARAEYGSYDSVNATAQLSGSSGAFSGSIGGNWYRTDGVSQFAGGAERDGFRQYDANARLGIALGEDFDIDLRGNFADSRTDLDGFAPPTYAFGDTDEYSTAREIYGYAGLNARLFDGKLKNRLAFVIADIDRDNFNPDFGPAPSFLARGRTERFEYQGDLALSEMFRAVFGAETETSKLLTDDGFSRTAAKTGIDSFYGQIVVKPVAALTLTGGVRHDDHEQFGGHTTIGANAALKLGTGTLLRANYGEGFKAPTLFQLDASLTGYGNRLLKPEQAKSYDVGIQQTLLDGALVAGVTLFQRRTRNQIDFISCAAPLTGICANRPYGTYDNIARARAKGLEFLLEMKPVEALDFTASYSFTDAENRTPGANFGKDLARRPRHTVTATVDYAPMEGLSLGADVLHVGDSFDNAANSVRLDSYVLTGIRAAYTIDGRFTLYGRVDNLFDVNYQTVSGYGTFGRAAYIGVRAGF
ncbi:TonB-dependent receptor plug domain-containing protein [Sphingomonas colocasiae]|uniref:TonB-dependent receptor plug domain-containing protein n=1 Tax=Sphingomonas colocasiae TaxID=1848973 RepID=UPI0031BA6336